VGFGSPGESAGLSPGLLRVAQGPQATLASKALTHPGHRVEAGARALTGLRVAPALTAPAALSTPKSSRARTRSRRERLLERAARSSWARSVAVRLTTYGLADIRPLSYHNSKLP
jgi:hypothetical protein